MSMIFLTYHCLGIGGSLPLEAVPYPRESPSEEHPKRGFKGRPKTPLTGDMGQFSHPKCRLSLCLHNQLYPKPGLFSYAYSKRGLGTKKLLSM